MKNSTKRSIKQSVADAVRYHIDGAEKDVAISETMPADTGRRFAAVENLKLDSTLHASIEPRRVENFKAGRLRVFVRLLVIIVTAVVVLTINSIARLSFRSTSEARARRLRYALQFLGGGAVKFGQQMSIRVDLISYTYADELKNLLDSGTAIKFRKARKSMERTFKGPIEEVFESFDETPIASASIACVYKGTLKDGAIVAVKVRRPGIGKLLTADIRAITWVVRLLELFYLPPGFTSRAMKELESMLIEELDFVREARYSEIFRNDMLNAKFKFATSPRVYFPLSSNDVMVAEFVEGHSLKHVADAVDRNDTVALQQLAEQNINPGKLARRMLKVHRFGGMEGHVFNADPHAANIIVRPGNKMVFLDFGSSGMFTEAQRVLWRRFLYARSIEDVSTMVQAGLAILEPLGRIDVDDFSKDMEYVFWQDICVFRSSNSHHWERNSAFMWFQFLGLTRKYRLAMNLDTLRMIRVTMLSDSLATRLDPTIDHFQEYLRYVEGANERARNTLKLRKETNLDSRYIQSVQLFDMTTSALFRLQRLLDTPFANFRAVVSKTAFVISVVTKLMTRAGLLLVLTISSWLSLDGIAGNDDSLVSGTATLLRNLIFKKPYNESKGLLDFYMSLVTENWVIAIVLMLGIVLPLVRRILYELDTMDR